MYKGILHTHTLVVTLFLLIYVIKTILLLGNRADLLQKFTKLVKVPEMIISALFLLTGLYLLMPAIGSGSKMNYLLWIKIAMVLVSIPLAVIGFKKSNKILAALSLLLITGSYGLAEVYHGKKAQADNSALASNDGKALYENNCKMCHGDDGKLGMSGAKDLSVSALDLNGMKEIILHGKGTMPASTLNEEQAQAVAEYVNASLKGK